MTSTTTLPTPPSLAGAHGVSFPGVLRSEWIKLFTLRSTVWCLAILVLLNIGLATLVSLATTREILGDANLPAGYDQSLAAQTITVGVFLSALVSCVLGALVITGEYGTGMIRSTFSAVPTRIPALLAKMLVFGVVAFLIGGLSMAIAAPLAANIMIANGFEVDLADPDMLLALLGAAGYLALIGMLAFTIGAIIRNSAGGIAAVLGFVLVVPVLVGTIAGLTQQNWLNNVANFLPSNAGGRMYAYPFDLAEAFGQPSSDELITLEPWQGGLVLGAWVLVMFVVAAVLAKRRDA